ncbi:MAG: hypothetical protein Q4C98_09050 [Capnocytophaga sp.]|nr:hypothetical protein [Capnocytophaga sp.]
MTEDNLHIKSGMQLPKGYFDQLKKELLNQAELESYIPKNYFEQSKKAILNATSRKPKTIFLPFIRYAVASVVGLLIISVSWKYLSKNQSDTIYFSDLTSTEIQNYFDNAYLEDKNYLILEATNDVQIEQSFVDEPISNIDDYLSEYDYRLDEF